MKINNTLNPNISINQKKVEENLNHISNPKLSAKDVNKLVEDILELNADTASEEIANFNNAIGYMQIADGALNSVSDNLEKISELQVRSNNAALNSDNLAAINAEISKLSENINKTLTSTTYNGKNVFDGSLNFNGIEISTQMPLFSLENIDDFRESLNNVRSNIASFMNEATDKIDNLNTFVINTKAAKSNFEPDIAKEVTDYKNNSIKLNASILAQAHNIQTLQQNITKLLG